MITEFILKNQCFTVKCFSMWQKCIITFVASVINLVKVSVLLYLLIYLLKLKALWPKRYFTSYDRNWFWGAP